MKHLCPSSLVTTVKLSREAIAWASVEMENSGGIVHRSEAPQLSLWVCRGRKGEKIWLQTQVTQSPTAISFLLNSLGTELKKRGHSTERIFPSMPVPSHMEATTDSSISCVLPEVFLACTNTYICFLPSPFFHPWKYTTHCSLPCILLN